MPREPDPRLLEIWREIGDAIESGDIQGLFVVWEQTGPPAYGCGCRTGDLHALLEEVKHQAIRVRARELN